jgi:ABC-type Zn uptake system ZnuABC Zn-binding protein ZnuA
MRHRATVLAGAVVLLAVLASGADGAHKLRVVTTIPDFKALVEEVGGAKGVDTYIGTIDYNVNVLAQALR